MSIAFFQFLIQLRISFRKETLTLPHIIFAHFKVKVMQKRNSVNPINNPTPILLLMKMEKDEIDEDEDLETETYKKYRKISITLPNNVAEKAEEYAEAHKMKRSQVIALALERGLGDEDRTVKQLNRIESLIRKNSLKGSSKMNPSEEIVLGDEHREKIENLLEYCSPSSDSFEIEGDEGFLVQVQKRELTSSIWTDEMLGIFATKLSIAYENYFITPDAQMLIDRCSEAMELSRDQQNKLTEYFAELQGQEVEYTEAEEGEEESEKGEK